MTLFNGLSEIVHHDAPLADRTWLGVGGSARWLAQPTNDDQLAEIVKRCLAEKIPMKILGGGSNLLIRDEGYGGMVIELAGSHYKRIVFEGTRSVVGAGAKLATLISATVRAGLGGLEGLAGIPGTVGGGVRGNAGGKFGQISSRLVSVRTMDYAGVTQTLDKADMEFAYRWSSLRDLIILEAEFDLDAVEVDDLLRRYKEIWAYKQSVQPFARHTAGCTFKNPPNGSAGQLIDQAGLKGRTVGKAGISDQHANFIITQPGAKAADVLALIKLAKDRVKEDFGIELELEIDVW